MTIYALKLLLLAHAAYLMDAILGVGLDFGVSILYYIVMRAP